ncbi:conjugal transfer protein TraN [Candidatus Ferrigenium straubiae]|jgi:conjugal transfer mating pair stabilization protein TraN|uniref:conjugal transfer protein TraN n=1 Tax=Candidatus Ferrigenium straubiae TaxID=2919506 RepID=UPI003F4AB835
MRVLQLGLVGLLICLQSGIAQAAPTCIKTGEVCVDATPCKTISGVQVCLAGVTLPAGAVALADTCWHYTATYDCAGGMQSTCQPLIDKGCGLTKSNCITYRNDGVTCSAYEQTYQCTQTPAVSSTGTTCGATTFCLNGQCFDLARPQNHDMQKTAAMMELARQAGNYQDPATMQFFKGTGNNCVNALFGLANCCTVGAAPGMSNAAQIGTATAINLGSSYVMDALGGSTGSAPNLFSQAYSYLQSPSCTALPGTTPFSFMGVSVNFTGTPMFSFDPTSLAISLAIMVVTDLLSCTQDEKMLSMKRGERLCIGTGSYCSQKVPLLGICLAVTETYCCYNSRLARIINQQGWAQLGTSVNASCDGFTQAQLSSIDFSKMDLTEFMAEIKSQIDIPKIQADMQARLNAMGNANGPTSPTANTPVLNPSAAGGYTGGFRLVAP